MSKRFWSLASIALWGLSIILTIVSAVIGYEEVRFAAFILALVMTVQSAYFGFAPINIFFTFVHGGTGKVVVKGGQPVRVLLPDGYAEDENGYIVESDVVWSWFGGLRFYGLWPYVSIFSYVFEWIGVRQGGQTKPYVERLVHFLLVPYPYYLYVPNVLDKNGMPINVHVQAVMRIANWRKALFGVWNWLNMALNMLVSPVRTAVGKYSYWDLINKDEGPEIQQAVYDALIESPPGDPRNIFTILWESYGIELVSVQVLFYETSMVDLTVKRVQAEQDALVTEITANAKANAIRAVNTAIQEGGAVALLTATLDGLAQGANKFVLFPTDLVANITSLLSGAGRQQPPGGGNPPANP